MRTEILKDNLFKLLNELKPLLNGVSKEDWKEVSNNLINNNELLYDYLMLFNKMDDVVSYDQFLLMCKDKNYLLTDEELDEASNSIVKMVGNIKITTDNDTKFNLVMEGHYRKLTKINEINKLDNIEMTTSNITKGITESILPDDHTIISIEDNFYLLKNDEVIGMGVESSMYGKLLTRLKIKI